MSSRFDSSLKKACGRKEMSGHISQLTIKHPRRNPSEIWGLSDKRKVTNEDRSCIPLQPIVFYFGKYLSSSLAFVDSLKSDHSKSCWRVMCYTSCSPQFRLSVFIPGLSSRCTSGEAYATEVSQISCLPQHGNSL